MAKRWLIGSCGVLLAAAVAVAIAVAGSGGGTSGHGILFVQPRGDFAPIYLWRPGAAARRLGPADLWADGAPAWSPGGKSIAFSGQISSGGWDEANANDVYVMRANGTGVRQLTHDSEQADGPFSETDPAWSPDGKEIVYERAGILPNNRIATISTASGRERVLPIRGTVLAWGAPGIAYVTRDSPSIKLYDPRTRRSRVFVPSATRFSDLAWSPAGRLAVLEEPSPHHNSLVVYSRAGSELARLRVKASIPVACVAWSPDGKRLLLVGHWGTANPRYRVWAAGLAGGGWRKLSPRSMPNCPVG
ncbi:MAG TPA: hypothetical protein VGH79_02945 [Gaiellaceae bacterium]|jgi:Tol biopolymer transport system component